MNDAYTFQRKHIRYTNWDYRTPGYYFITISTAQRIYLFDDSRFAQSASTVWQAIPTQPHATHIALDHYVIMPDHMHGILRICHFANPNQHEPYPSTDFKNASAGSVGSIVGIYKSLVARQINALRGTKGSNVWQRGYWDRIVRDEAELNRIRKYIDDNPRRWNEKRDNLDTIKSHVIYHP